jgi:hypothetical protein
LSASCRASLTASIAGPSTAPSAPLPGSSLLADGTTGGLSIGWVAGAGVVQTIASPVKEVVSSSSSPSLLGTSLALRGRRRGKNKGFQIGTHSYYCKIPVCEAVIYLAALSYTALLRHPPTPRDCCAFQRSSPDLSSSTLPNFFWAPRRRAFVFPSPFWRRTLPAQSDLGTDSQVIGEREKGGREEEGKKEKVW